MNYQVGKKYWRVKDDGGIYSFTIVKGIREARGIAEKNIRFIDTYYDEKDQKVLTDPDPMFINKNEGIIFETHQEAIDCVIERLQQLKMDAERDSFLEGK